MLNDIDMPCIIFDWVTRTIRPWIRSGDIRYRCPKLSDIALNSARFGPKNFLVKAPKFWDVDYNTEPTSVMWQFHGDQRTELGNKK